jgi:tRNA (cytidine/uridine-2'-O-)-methyltransferase
VFHVVLVEPEIPSNTGNIARLCAATACTLHLIHPLGFKLDDAALKRAGMDYWEIACIQQHDSLQDCLSAATSVYYFSTKATRAHWDPTFLPGDYLVFGRETKGLPEELLRQNSERSLTIPMMDKRARSLNLSTSVGVALYEAIRQTTQSVHRAS